MAHTSLCFVRAFGGGGFFFRVISVVHKPTIHGRQPTAPVRGICGDEGINRFRIDKDWCRVLCRGLLMKRLEDLLLVIQSLTAEPEADGS